jgi:hypothetical protein
MAVSLKKNNCFFITDQTPRTLSESLSKMAAEKFDSASFRPTAFEMDLHNFWGVAKIWPETEAALTEDPEGS